MEDNKTLQVKIPLELIKSQDIYIISSGTNVTDELKIIGLIIDISISTRELRNIIFDRLLVNDEFELIIPINGYTNLKANHMTIEIHTGCYIVWGKNILAIKENDYD